MPSPLDNIFGNFGKGLTKLIILIVALIFSVLALLVWILSARG